MSHTCVFMNHNQCVLLDLQQFIDGFSNQFDQSKCGTARGKGKQVKGLHHIPHQWLHPLYLLQLPEKHLHAREHPGELGPCSSQGWWYCQEEKTANMWDDPSTVDVIVQQRKVRETFEIREILHTSGIILQREGTSKLEKPWIPQMKW